MEETAQSYRQRLQGRLTIWSFKLELIATCAVILASPLERTPLTLANLLVFVIIPNLLKWILRSQVVNSAGELIPKDTTLVSREFEFGAQRVLSVVFFLLFGFVQGGSMMAAAMATLSVAYIGIMICILDDHDDEDEFVEEEDDDEDFQDKKQRVVDKLKELMAEHEEHCRRWEEDGDHKKRERKLKRNMEDLVAELLAAIETTSSDN